MSEKQLLSSRTDIQELLLLAPDWKPVLDSVVAAKKAKDEKSKEVSSFELLERLGAKAIYMKAQTLGPQQATLASFCAIIISSRCLPRCLAITRTSSVSGRKGVTLLIGKRIRLFLWPLNWL